MEVVYSRWVVVDVLSVVHGDSVEHVADDEPHAETLRRRRDERGEVGDRDAVAPPPSHVVVTLRTK